MGGVGLRRGRKKKASACEQQQRLFLFPFFGFPGKVMHDAAVAAVAAAAAFAAVVAGTD